MAKKHWILSVFQNGSKDNTNTEQIFWESSSSEDEHPIFNKKRPKKLSEVNCNISPILTFQKNNLDFTHQQDNMSVSSAGFIESPVLGLKRSELYKLSPNLSQRSMSVFVKEPSPVIERRRVRLRGKHHKSKENHINDCPSPDLFNCEPSQLIRSESPVFSVCTSQATINIEPFPSQFSSQVVPSDMEIKGNSLYYEPPKRKKSYKKGGLAHQLHKALKLKRSRAKIWHHEKLHAIENDFENQDVIRFKLKKIWKEYGNTLLQCEGTNDDINSSITMIEKGSDSFSDNVSNNIFLLNIGASSILSIEWKTDNIYQLYPPYTVDRVSYGGEDLLYYSNASKFFM